MQKQVQMSGKGLTDRAWLSECIALSEWLSGCITSLHSTHHNIAADRMLITRHPKVMLVNPTMGPGHVKPPLYSTHMCQHLRSISVFDTKSNFPDAT